MAALLRSNPPLRRLLAAWLQSCLGTGAGYVALLLLTLRDLHTSWAVSAVLLAEFLPAIAFGWWFGSLADRHSRRTLIVAANLLQAGAFAAIAFVSTAVPIVALALVAGTGNALLRPSLRSSLPTVAGEHNQVAIALYDTCRWVGITLGPAIAGGLYALSGVRLALLLNGLSFLVAAAVMGSLPLDAPRGTTPEQSPSGDGVRAGLREAFAAPGIVTILACSAGSIIGGGLLNVCEPLLATRVLHGSGSAYALLVATYGTGMVLATTLIARRGAVDGGLLTRRYVAALTLTAAGMSGCAIVGSLLPAAIAFAATGYANALLLVSETQLIQLRVAGAVQGRLFGAKDTLEGTCLVAGLVAAGGLVATIGTRNTLAIGAAMCAACAAVAIILLRRPSADAHLR